MYEKGRRWAGDDTEAAGLVILQCKKFARAQCNLGFMYQEGQGSERGDDAEAAAWYRKAAEQDLADAQFNLGLMYEGGAV